MNRNYESLSLETHLFFGRIMKEQSLFLLAGFPSKNAEYIKKADWFRSQFEEMLWEAVRLAEDDGVGKDVLESEEIVTGYTLGAEKRTSFLTGIEIDSRITEAEIALSNQDRCKCTECRNRRAQAKALNRKALRLVDGLGQTVPFHHS